MRTILRESNHRAATACVVIASAIVLLSGCGGQPKPKMKGVPTPARPPLALSIHIGVKRLSPSHYGPIDPLQAPATDARAMQRVARGQHFTSPDDYLLLNEEATAGSLLTLLAQAAEDLQAGDTLFLTFSGHGCRLPDKNADEPSGYDSAWCMYDRALVDDEVHEALSHLRSGVSVLVLSDSCHSGSVVSAADKAWKPIATGPSNGIVLVSDAQRAPRPALLRGIKELTYEEFKDLYASNKALYDGIQARVPGPTRTAVQASVVLLAACQDNQITEDGPDTSVFTSRVLALWDDGRFTGTLQSFYDTLRAAAEKEHTPNLYVVGKPAAHLLASRPFTPIGRTTP